MAPSTIINNQKSFGASFGEKLGEHLGSGLSSGLQQLANQKLEKMQRKNAIHELRQAIPDLPDEALPWLSSLPAKELNQALENFGNQRREAQEQQLMAQQQQQQQEEEIPDEHFTPEVFQHIQEQLQNPEVQEQLGPEKLQLAQNNLMKMQERLANNPVGQNPFPQAAQAAPAQQQQPQQAPPASKGGIPLTSFGKGAAKDLAREKQDLAREKFEFEKKQVAEKPKSEARIKQEEAIATDAKQIADVVSTTKRMQKRLASGKVDPGVINQGLSRLAPTFLEGENEGFDKDSSHILNLASAQQKGQQSKYRLQTLEKEKPGLGHSVKVNKEIVDRMNEEAEANLRSLLKRHPGLEYSDEVVISLLPDPSDYSDDTVVKEKLTGKSFYKAENGKWEAV